MAMRSITVFIGLCLYIHGVNNVMIPLNYPPPDIEEPIDMPEVFEKSIHENPYRVLGLKDLKQTTTGYDYGLHLERKRLNENTKKPCSVVVLSSGHHSAMQSLLRKYRYDANGILIPSSVKYYIKLPPQNFGAEPVLVPLIGNAISPLGGYVRYYKEVPPIPPSL